MILTDDPRKIEKISRKPKARIAEIQGFRFRMHVGYNRYQKGALNMKAKSGLLITGLAAISLFGVQCSESPEVKQDAAQTDKPSGSENTGLKGDMETIAAKILQKSPREQSYAEIETVVTKFPEDALLAFVADKYRELDPVSGRRIVSQLAEAGFKKFGTAKWQYYHAFYVGAGIDTPPDPARSLAILDMPASGTMRNSLTLRAKMLMRLGDSSVESKGKIEELLKQASEQGDGEATELLKKVGL